MPSGRYTPPAAQAMTDALIEVAARLQDKIPHLAARADLGPQ